MRFSISKAIAAIALISVASLIAVSLLADASRASAQVDERRVHQMESNQSDDTTQEFWILENKTAAAGETLIRVGKVLVRDRHRFLLDTDYVITGNAITDNGDEIFQINPPGKDSGANKNVLWATMPLNFEDENTYLLVVASDNSEQARFRNIRVNVQDVSEPPFFVRDDIDGMTREQVWNYCSRDRSVIELADPPVIRINENAAIGSVIAKYGACDPDGDDIDFMLRSSPDSAYFDIHTINWHTGQLRVDGVLDYELKSTYAIEVEITDFMSDPISVTQRIHLNDDTNEPVAPTPTRTAAPTATPTSVPGTGATPTPTMTPGRVDQDVLHRVGALEQLLARLQTLIQSLQGVIAAQDSRIAAQDSRIAALEAQLGAATLTPTPTPSPTATPSPTPAATPESTAVAASACVQTIGAGSVSGSWTSACLTANPTHGNTYYARFYTFTLDAAADVTISLTSDKPPYLYLLAGEGTSGDVLRQAGGNSQTSVAITDTLQAGSYTIEASTWQPKTTGDFTLTLTARQ